MSSEVGERIRNLRYRKGWGPGDLADASKVSRTAIFQIESGSTKKLRAETMRKIADALEVPPEHLIYGEPNALSFPDPAEVVKQPENDLAVDQLRILLKSRFANHVRQVVQSLHNAFSLNPQ